ncbi:MAG: hypothetical protein JWN15_664 [Firmicutes bacterium]|nr:hypothetical protein [Bacillota bacterium]
MEDNRRLPLIMARIAKGMTLRQLAQALANRGVIVSRTILGRLENSWDIETRDEVKQALCAELNLNEFPERSGAGVTER